MALSMQNELVVLVDEDNNVIGTQDKATVHTTTTPLHRGFSLFLFNSANQLLVTHRAYNKKTFPGVWTNTVCGHPAPDETVADAAKRRLAQELSLSGIEVREVSPYRYQVADASGIMENEICPILVGLSDMDPTPNDAEVDEWKWMDWEEFLTDIKNDPASYSPWCIEEAGILKDLNVFNR